MKTMVVPLLRAARAIALIFNTMMLSSVLREYFITLLFPSDIISELGGKSGLAISSFSVHLVVKMFSDVVLHHLTPR